MQGTLLNVWGRVSSVREAKPPEESQKALEEDILHQNQVLLGGGRRRAEAEEVSPPHLESVRGRLGISGEQSPAPT